MQEQEVRSIVNKIIEENALDATIVKCEFEDVEMGFEIVVEVARKDYDRVFTINNGDLFISWRQRQPEFVGAEVGDFVLIYSEHVATDAESEVGLISSKFTEEDGSVYYGCRYIQIGLDNTFVNHLYDFELTKEDYGGYHKGFLKVLTAEEVISHLKNQLKVAKEKELQDTQVKFERSVNSLPKLIDSLKNVKKVQCEKVSLDNIHLSFSLKID